MEFGDREPNNIMKAEYISMYLNSIADKLSWLQDFADWRTRKRAIKKVVEEFQMKLKIAGLQMQAIDCAHLSTANGIERAQAE